MKAMKMDELTKQIALEAIALERESVKMYRDQAAKIEQVILKMEKDLGIEATPAAPVVEQEREIQYNDEMRGRLISLVAAVNVLSLCDGEYRAKIRTPQMPAGLINAWEHVNAMIVKAEKHMRTRNAPAAPVVEQRELLPMFKVIDREIYDSYFVRLMQLRRSYPECSDADLLMYELCRTFQLRKDEQAQRTDGEAQQ